MTHVMRDTGDPPPHPTLARADYEFTEEQRDSVRSLAASMSFVGACLMLFGILLALFALIAVYAGFPLGAIGLFVVAAAYTPTAWWTMSGGRSLSAIPRTRGHDVEHLMEAVRQLRRLFAFARAVILVQTLLLTAIASIFVWCTFVIEKTDRCLSVFG
ncbi:MAG TPA: hypothetical protein VEK07_25395 [Polyangiaceae bacterium]|nr:hypothetical protein [Polyangiaceae bacterium]